MSDHPTLCPCCGQQTQAMSIERLVAVASPLAAEIISRLMKAPGEFVTSDAIARYIYRNEASGGPINYAACINQVISYNRPKLAAMGWLIESRLGPYGGYRLCVSPQARMAA